MKKIVQILMLLAFVAVLTLPASAQYLDTNLVGAAEELTDTWGGVIKPLIWSVALALVGLSWLKLTKKR